MQAGIADRESRLLHMARHDAATGLPNRMFAEEWLDGRLQTLGRGERVGIVLIAVTNLQEISASLGFDITEQLVWHLARCLEHWSEQGGLVARIDATHFLVAKSPVTEAEMTAFARNVRERSQAPLATAGIALQAAVVLGAVVASRQGGNATELLRCAEAAVETAIQQRQPFAFFERASDEAQRRRLKLGADLVEALQSEAALSALSAEVPHDGPACQRCRGAGALAASRVRHGVARGVRAHRRTHRCFRRTDTLGVAHGAGTDVRLAETGPAR